MSDYHVLRGNRDGTSYRIAHHIPIPDVNNDVGNSYRTLISAHEDTTSEVAGLSQSEQTALDNGELFEWTESIKLHPSESTTSYRDRIDARHNELIGIVQTALQNKYRFHGFERDVP